VTKELNIANFHLIPFQITKGSTTTAIQVCKSTNIFPIKIHTIAPTLIKANDITEVTLGYKSTLPYSQLVIIEKHDKLYERYGIIFKRALIEIGGEIGTIKLFLQNSEDYDKTLPKGVVVGIAEDIDYQDLVSIHTPHTMEARPVFRLTTAQINKLDINPVLNKLDRQHLIQLLVEYGDCFAWEYTSLGKCNIEQFTIDVGDTRPIYSPPYQHSAKEREIVKDLIEEMLENDINEPSNSPHGSPVLLVPKKNGKMRMVIDYRRLNAITRRDVYPLARIDDLLDSVRNAQVFSRLDLFAGYHQCPIAESDKEKTAFIIPQGLYQFKRLPFGLQNAPSYFSRVMNTAMAGLTFNSV